MGISSGYRFIVDQKRNGYAMENSSGAIYELPVNQEQAVMGKRFRLAPWVATDRNTSGNRCTSVIVYDSDNQRFMQWTENILDVCFPIPDPQDALFSYTTGKELVYMEPTLNANTIVYAILKDSDGKYYLYGISMAFAWTGTVYRQHYFAEINATAFEQATAFAFHSKLPYLFYAYMNEIWEYDYSTKQARRVAVLGDKETVTMIKFNRFTGSYSKVPKPDEYFEMQYRLIVGSVDGNVEGDNNGILRFYEVPELNRDLVLYGKPYTGFAEIKDVVFREN